MSYIVDDVKSLIEKSNDIKRRGEIVRIEINVTYVDKDHLGTSLDGLRLYKNYEIEYDKCSCLWSKNCKVTDDLGNLHCHSKLN